LLPIGAFAAVMGLAGLGLTARAAAPLFPGVFRAPAYFTELWVALGVLTFVVLLPLYVLKVIRHREEVKGEFSNPASLGFCGALPVGMSLVAGGLAPYLPGLADALWWAAVVVFAAFFAWGVYRIVTAGVRTADVYPAWLVIFVGGIVYPGSGLGLGHGDASRILFGVSAVAALFLYGLIVYRAIAAPALPARLRPSWLILLVPPSLIGAYGPVLFGIQAFEYLFFAALALLAVLLVYALRVLSWEFSPVWWSMTFPLDAFAYAATRYAQDHASPAWRALAGFSLLLATLVVCLVAVKNLAALFARPRSAPSRAA
jgi:tellurite resistance protein